MENTKKVIVVGNACSGKTEVCRRLTGTDNDGEEYVYTPTLGCEIYPYHDYTIWDCAGEERFGGLRDGYYIAADIALMFKGGKDSDYYPKPWVTDVYRVVGDSVPLYEISGSIEEKYAKVKEILSQ